MHTLLFTDVVDSTQRVQQLGDEAATAMWTRHDDEARRLLDACGGREIDRSDGYFLLFDTAADALRFARGYHEALTGLGLSARVALHTAEVLLRPNAPEAVRRGAKPLEVEGLAKPLAARVMSLARGGTTLLTAATVAALGDAGHAGELVSRGWWQLKGLSEPVEILEWSAQGAASTPPADAEKAWRVVRDGDLWRPAREVRHNLPAERDAFIGRADDLLALGRRCDDGSRCINLLGMGGTGKTRLARRFGRMRLGDSPGGVYFCDLSEARSIEGVCHAAALALGAALTQGDAAAHVGRIIAGRGRCLVILDNFEQVAHLAAATLGAWLDAAPQAQFLVTSRERLQLPGEEVHALAPLPIDGDAIALFEVRACAHDATFALDAGHLAAVSDIVRLLDGLPLAIELAAARVRILSPAQIARRLADRFALLGGARGGPARQATLRAAIDWSWQLLAPWEQSALAQCAVFEGGFTLEAAEAVLDLSPWREAPAAIDVVQSLVDKSLVRAWIGKPDARARASIDEPYFGLYLSIHEYAAGKLRDAGIEAAAQERHGRHFAAMGRDEALRALNLTGGAARRQALVQDLDNLVAACTRSLARGQLDAAVDAYAAAFEVFMFRGPLAPADRLAEALKAAPLSPEARARVDFRHGQTLLDAGRPEESRRCLESMLAHCRSVGDAANEGRALQQIGALANRVGDAALAEAAARQALALHRQAQSVPAESATLLNLGNIAFDAGRFEDSVARYVESLALSRACGDVAGEARAWCNLGNSQGRLGRPDEALRSYHAAVPLMRQVGNLAGEATVLANLAEIQAGAGDLPAARETAAAGAALARDIGHRIIECAALGNLAEIDMLLGHHAAAREGLHAALELTRQTRQKPFEGAVLGTLGRLLAQLGEAPAARQAYDDGERVLREIGDLANLSRLLYERARFELAQGDLEAAVVRHAELARLAAELHLADDSELGRQLAQLQAELDDAGITPGTAQ